MFIEVTGINEKFILNANNIQSIWLGADDTYRVIDLTNGDSVRVQETYEELKQLLPLGGTFKR